MSHEPESTPAVSAAAPREGTVRAVDPRTDSLVVVLAGGLSHERDVSLRSGRRVASALRGAGCADVLEFDVSAGLLSRLVALGSPVVFPVLHGGAGEDGALRQALELAGIPFVGSSAAASRVAFDKSIGTRVAGDAGLRTPQQVALPDDLFRELGAGDLVAALGARMGFPLAVKPSRSGSALGFSRVDSAEALPQAMVQAFGYGPVAVVETYITGTEISVAVVDTGDGPRALPAVEILPDSGRYDYEARYTAGQTRFIAPAAVADDLAQRCAEMALSAHVALGLADISRTDLIVGDDGEPVFLEVNVAPGMTETSLVPLAVEAAGLDLGALLVALVGAARERGPR